MTTTLSPAVRFGDAQIEMSHGAGGKASRRLVEGLIPPTMMAEAIGQALGDAANLTIGDARLAITTDSFVVRPLRFPGGSIGELAINGTVNDLAVSGAVPLALVCSLIVHKRVGEQRRSINADPSLVFRCVLVCPDLPGLDRGGLQDGDRQ